MAKESGIEGYERRAAGTGKVATPDSSGMRGAINAQTAYLNGLGQLIGAIGGFANSYLDIVNERKERDADTEISKIFRDRRVDITQNKKGKGVDNLLNDEDEWQKATAQEVREKHGMPSSRFNTIWNRHADPYLDRIGAYQVEQQAAYDKQSRLANAEAGLDTLMNTRIGDMGPVKQYFDQVNKLFPNDPATAEKLKDQGIQTAVKYWSRLNPSATVSWFRTNKEVVKEAIGKDFIKVSDVIAGTESKIQSEAAHMEVLANRAERIRKREQEKYDDSAYGTAVTKVLAGNFAETDMFGMSDDPRLSGETKAKIYNFAKKVETNDFSKASDLAEAQFTADAYSGNLTEERQKQLMDAGAAGKVKPEVIRTAMAINETYKKNVTAEIKPVVDQASKYVENYYAPSNGLMGSAKPAEKQRYMQVNAAILEYSKGKSVPQLTKDLNFNDPDSWINTLIKMNPTVTSGRSWQVGPLQLGWKPAAPVAPDGVKAPTAATAASPNARKPGETRQQWKARIGK